MAITTESDAWTYTETVAEHLKAAGLNVTDTSADEIEIAEDEMGYTGHIEIDDGEEGYGWDTARGWKYFLGSDGGGAYGNVEELLWGEDWSPAEVTEKILARRPPMTDTDQLRDRVADAIARAHVATAAAVHPLLEDYHPAADAALGVIEPDAERRTAYHDQRVEWARKAERNRIRAAIEAEIDDHDPDHTFRRLTGNPQPGQGDPGHAGNSWWRAYCHVGGMLHALACTEPEEAPQ